MKETTIHISDGLYINGVYVDNDPYITVTRSGNLIKVETAIYVDISNFSMGDGVTRSNATIVFDQDHEDL